MRLVPVLFAFSFTITAVLAAQTTVANLNQDPITSPNQTNSNVRSWGSSTGTLVGCGATCSAGSMSHTSYYTLSGDSLQLNLNNPSACGANCYGDVDFSNKIYLNDATASSANNFTLDLSITMDSVGNAKSQALEFTIEQDVPSTRTLGYTDRYIYSWQCNYKGAVVTQYSGTGAQGGVWNLWDGTANNGVGDWVEAKTTSGGTVPCGTYSPAGGFVHYYFHFQRLPSTYQVKFVDFTTVNSAGVSTYYQFNQVKGIQNPQSNWATGLFTALQLDGNVYQDQYSVWADNWKIAFQ